MARWKLQIMRKIKSKIIIVSVIFLITLIFSFTNKYSRNDQFISYIFDKKTTDLELFWKNDQNEILKSFENLKSYLEKKQKTLLFAMNAGMFKKDYSPQGLFIQDGYVINPIDTSTGFGNFYLMPNGIFYITKEDIFGICKSQNFVDTGTIKFATQSGPMLVIDGQIHPAFIKGSKNLNIRNGVGILPDNKVIFTISKKEINFYDFAYYFKELGCKNALYLDGFVSKIYYPAINVTQMDGNFGVMIGITQKNSCKRMVQIIK